MGCGRDKLKVMKRGGLFFVFVAGEVTWLRLLVTDPTIPFGDHGAPVSRLGVGVGC